MAWNRVEFGISRRVNGPHQSAIKLHNKNILWVCRLRPCPCRSINCASLWQRTSPPAGRYVVVGNRNSIHRRNYRRAYPTSSPLDAMQHVCRIRWHGRCHVMYARCFFFAASHYLLHAKFEFDAEVYFMEMSIWRSHSHAFTVCFSFLIRIHYVRATHGLRLMCACVYVWCGHGRGLPHDIGFPFSSNEPHGIVCHQHNGSVDEE